MKKILIITGFALLILNSCSKDKGGSGGGGGGGGGTTINCATVTNKAFAADVAPIFQSVCSAASCHNAGSSNGPGALTSYNQIFAARSTIRSVVFSGAMPKNSALSTSQKSSIICWIDNGAPNN
jgi:hypothetical protein